MIKSVVLGILSRARFRQYRESMKQSRSLTQVGTLAWFLGNRVAQIVKDHVVESGSRYGRYVRRQEQNRGERA
jgi:hypothetical protein